MGSCSPVSMVDTSLAGGNFNAVGCDASGVGSLGVSVAACLASNFLTVGGLVIWASAKATGIQVCLSRLGRGVATITCHTLPQGMDSLSLVRKLPNSRAWGAIELDMVWLGWATWAGGSVPSRWASSCSSMFNLCSMDTGAASCGTSGTSGSSASGTFPRVAWGVPFVFFFFGAHSAESASTSFFFFFFLSFFGFFSRGGSEAADPGSPPRSFLHLSTFFFFSSKGSSGLVF